MKIFRDIEQGSDEWKRIRKARPTASRFSDIITAAKGELSKSATGYIRELIGEAFCPDFEYWTGNQFTERGKDLEPVAREAFASVINLKVEQVGFVLGADGVCGCSPDALLLDDDGNIVAGVEIKCPTPKTHIAYVLDGGLPDEYRQQVHGSLAVTGLGEWHFWSFFPGLAPHHHVVRRDEYTAKVESALKSFVAQYHEMYAIAEKKLRVREIRNLN